MDRLCVIAVRLDRMCGSTYGSKHEERTHRQSFDWCSRVLSLYLRFWVSSSRHNLLRLQSANQISPLGWAPFIADSFVYNAPSTKRWGIFSTTALGFIGSKVFMEFVGIGTQIRTVLD